MTNNDTEKSAVNNAINASVNCSNHATNACVDCSNHEANASVACSNKIIKKVFLYAVFVFILFCVDQYTKWLAATYLKDGKSLVLIKNILSLSYLENSGAAWGVLSGRIILFIILTCILILFIILTMYRLEKLINLDGKKFFLLQLNMAVLLAGALGNLADRIVNGYVVDFIKTDFIDFPVFNIADCYVTIAMILLIIILLCFVKEDELDKIFYLKKIKKEN